MDVSVVALLTNLSDAMSGKGAAPADGADDGSAGLFGQLLSDHGASLDMSGGGAGDLGSDRVTNLMAAQGSQSDTNYIIGLLASSAQGSLKQLGDVTITPEQAGKLADTIAKFLQQPDTAATLTDQQRNAFAGLLTDLRQMAKGEGPQSLAPVLAQLDKALPATAANVKERLPVVGQLAKWLEQVLRGKAAQPTASDADDGAPLKGATQTPFPGDSDNEKKETKAEEGQTAVPIITLLVPTEPQPVKTSEADVSVQSVNADAEQALPQVALPDMDEDAALLAVQADKQTDAKSLASSDFATLLQKDGKAHSDMVQQAAQNLNSNGNAAPAANNAPSRTDVVNGVSVTATEATKTQTADAVSATSDSQTQNQTQGQGQPQGVAVVLTSQASHANAPSPVAMHVQTQRREILDQVQVGIKQLNHDGTDRITIQLQPEKLGRIDVRMDVNANGQANIVFHADKADTLEQLQRDARFLEKALQDAGIKADTGSMQFNLRQQNQNAMAQMGANTGDGSGSSQWAQGAETANGTVNAIDGEGDAQTDALPAQNYTLSIDRGLDIRV